MSWMTDPKTKQKSVSLTLMTGASILAAALLLVSMVSKVANFEIREFEASDAATLLAPFLALYFGRKWTDTPDTPVDPNAGM